MKASQNWCHLPPRLSSLPSSPLLCALVTCVVVILFALKTSGGFFLCIFRTFPDPTEFCSNWKVYLPKCGRKAQYSLFWGCTGPSVHISEGTFFKLSNLSFAYLHRFSSLISFCLNPYGEAERKITAGLYAGERSENRSFRIWDPGPRRVYFQALLLYSYFLRMNGFRSLPCLYARDFSSFLLFAAGTLITTPPTPPISLCHAPPIGFVIGWLNSFSKRLRKLCFFFQVLQSTNFENLRRFLYWVAKNMEDCLNSFLLSYLVCIPYLAKLSFGHFSSITKMGGGGGGGLYIYIYIHPATNRSLDVANLIIFISKNRGNKSLKKIKNSCCFFFHFLEIFLAKLGNFATK